MEEGCKGEAFGGVSPGLIFLGRPRFLGVGVATKIESRRLIFLGRPRFLGADVATKIKSRKCVCSCFSGTIKVCCNNCKNNKDCI